MIVGPAIWSSKAAILALYIRIFAPLRWLRLASYTVLGLTFLFYWVTIPLTGAFCTPRRHGLWDFNVLSRCATTAVMGPIHGAIGLAADITILILPLPIVPKLNTTMRNKVGLAIVFLAGILYARSRSVNSTHANREQRSCCQYCISVLSICYLDKDG